MTDIFDAVSTDNLVRLKYFHEKGAFMYMCNSNTLCNIAAETGHINCLKYLHENGYFWDKTTCWRAALNGHIECLKYAHENGCAWDINRCGYAAKYSHLPSPQYAHKNGHLKCVKYLYENGCPCNKEFISTIVQKILIPKWRAAVKSRQIIIYWMERSAQTACAENGRARIEDEKSFENDCNSLIV